MKCYFYCTAESYKLKSILEYFRTKEIKCELFDEAVYIQITDQGPDNIDIFFFEYGCSIIWGGNEAICKDIINQIKPFESNPLPNTKDDLSTYILSTSQKSFISEDEDKIILESDDMLIKLSMSHAFAQSVKLIHFEEVVSRTIEVTKSLTHELATYGKISLSRSQLAKKVGVLFVERSSINLSVDVLDIPEFFWRRPKYEPYYLMASAYMDIGTRLDILNRRLSVVHDFYSILSEELNHIHSSRLELTIIILIVIEVLLVILKDILHLI